MVLRMVVVYLDVIYTDFCKAFDKVVTGVLLHIIIIIGLTHTCYRHSTGLRIE